MLVNAVPWRKSDEGDGLATKVGGRYGLGVMVDHINLYVLYIYTYVHMYICVYDVCVIIVIIVTILSYIYIIYIMRISGS